MGQGQLLGELVQPQQSDGSFNVILSNIQPILSTIINVSGLTRQILTAYYRVNGNMVSVSCAHLTSLTKNIERRRKELKQLTLKLQLYNKQQKSNRGDLNIHSQQQNTIFNQLNYIDSWIQYHTQNNNDSNNMDWKQIIESEPGYTFDGEVNSMIKEVYWGFQSRRMRLDRIVHRAGIRCKSMRIVLNEPVYKQEQGQGGEYARMGTLKGVASLLFDIAGYNIFRTKEKYLFPSDHFGLLCQFQVPQHAIVSSSTL